MKRICIILCFFVLLTALPVQAAQPEVPVKSALLMDMTTGTVLFAQNEHERLAPASVTKVMTLLLIMEAIDEGLLAWEDTVTASEEAASKGGSQIYLKAGEQMTVTDLVKSIAVSSANDAACAMAEHIAGSEGAFVEKMNERAQQLGMENTHFANCTGLDDTAGAQEHYTTAYDIALMSRELMANHPQIEKFTTIWMDSIRGGTFGLANTNKLVRFYPGATGLKTGFTSQAGYCLSATASRDGMGLVAVVMGAESSKERFAACKQLLDYGFAGYALIQPQTQEETVCVKLGTAATVAAVPAQPVKLLVEKGQKKDITVQIQLDAEVTAPVSRGQKLGTLTVYCAQQVLATVPMVAAEAVPRLTWIQLFGRILRQLAAGGEGNA